MARAVRSLVASIRLHALAPGSIKKYGGDFKLASMAAHALGLDPFNLTSDDLSYLAVFHTLGHSVHSLDSFFSAIAAVYKELGKELPRDSSFQATKKGLKRIFVPVDEVKRAFPLSSTMVQRLLALLDPSSWEDAVFGFWLSLSFVWALRTDDWKWGRLKWCDITFRPDFSFSVVFFPGKGSQHHGRVRRVLPSMATSSGVNPAFWLVHLILALPKKFRSPQNAVLVRPSRSKGHSSPVLVTSSWVSSRLRGLFVTLGEPVPANLSCYSTRRGGATAYAKAGLQNSTIREILRHKNEETTEVYIQQISSAADSEALAKLLA